MSGCILSLLSPVLRTMICGSFKESICREISLDDLEAERLLKLMRLACGNRDIAAKDVVELLGLGELAERLQMETARSEIEKTLLKEIRVENCLEMIQRSEATGLELLQKECYKILRNDFGVISQKDGFLELSEEMMGCLLEEDELGVSREEDVFEALLRWISNSDHGVSGDALLRKIRYGVISIEYLAGHMASALLPELKQIVGEAMAKKGAAEGEEMWDGVKRLGDKWIVARGMKGRIIGADVLKRPRYVAIDEQGRIIVTDGGLHEVIVFNRDGSIAQRFGSNGAAVGQFNQPAGVAVDGQGHIVVADYGNHRIQVLNMDGSVARCFGSFGTAVGQLHLPFGLAINSEGHIVVADHGNHRIQVYDAGGSVVRHFGSKGSAVGQLCHPMGVAVDGAGRIVVTDWINHRVQVFDDGGAVTLCFGSKGDGPGQLEYPYGVAVDNVGRFIVSDSENGRIQVFNLDGTAARLIDKAGDGVGQISSPLGVVVDGAGRIVVAEWDNHRVQVL